MQGALRRAMGRLVQAAMDHRRVLVPPMGPLNSRDTGQDSLAPMAATIIPRSMAAM